VIASLSLGAVRRFRLKPRRAEDGRDVHVIDLEHGSLLRMAGDTQRLYVHDLPKTRASIGPRINLTFRQIMPPAQNGSEHP
jgi:alkylated DNA repair dioxygenase AlkB